MEKKEDRGENLVLLLLARSKMADIAQSLGLSNSLLRVINRREWGDSIIVYSGMVVTLVVLYIVWRFARG